MIVGYNDDDRDHPKGIERCFHTQLGEPWKLDFWCCIEEPSHCFPEIEPQLCLKECPPLRKGPSPSPGYNPKGTERCFHKQLGWPVKLDYLCCIEKASNCFPKMEPERCLKECPPLRKGAAPSPL
ncbi:unnamed protein product [Arabis nemorensis]|uniref:Uncharacterized protein n=1 Tax=Arabis nemorensis TaxID=586526 RepID=A0A565BL60_9BRAS|nr:unnamed protein product [Arabis nemorensis]